jgi:hypothetical protein
MKIPLVALCLCAALSITPSALESQSKQGDFLVDPSKHYVYLEFDHTGHREPLPGDEGSQGLWLRLVNNCRIPIVVATFNLGTGDPGLGVFDEVVPVAVKPIVHFNRPGGAKHVEASHAKVARGYSPPDITSTTTVSSGENLLFSVPLNHVGPSWYLQVRFYLDVPGDPYDSGPYSVVSFNWQDIPQEFRHSTPVSVSPKPTTP